MQNANFLIEIAMLWRLILYVKNTIEAFKNFLLS